MSAVAVLDAGGSSVKALVLDGGQVVGSAAVATPVIRPGPDRAEADPDAWQAAARTALAQAVAQAGARTWAGLTVTSLRQGFVLLDAAGATLGPAVLNSDGRGAGHTGCLDDAYAVTGHWPAPQLTLPKLLHVAATEPERWAATARVLFVHDWLLWLLTGEQVTEVSYACAGAMADVAARTWAADLLDRTGVGTARLAPLVEAGTVVGGLRPGWGLPPGLPVVSGCADTQVAALGAGGLADGVVTVVAGSSTPVQAATAEPLADPLQRPWLSTHARADLWAAEGNAGYPGTFAGWWGSRGPVPDGPGTLVAVTAAPYWAKATWSGRPPVSLVGLTPDTTDGDVTRALAEAHAFAVRGGVEDLERALGRPADEVVLTGGGAPALAPLLAQVLGRPLRLAGAGTAGPGAEHLVQRALGADGAPPGLPAHVVAAGDPGPWQQPYARWRETVLALTAAFG